jgi:N-acetylneuraminate synthase
MIENDLMLVAELSANHNNSLDLALRTIQEFSKHGATAIKLQTYTPDTMTLDVAKPDFIVSRENKLWGGRTLYDLYAEAMTPWEWHQELFTESRRLGLIPFSTPFDSSAVDFLETLDCPIYKIASFEVVDVKLIHYAASTGKPLIISTGMATLGEIDQAVQAARDGGCKDITLLKTTSAYPASPEHSNLRTMPVLGSIFGTKFGISDHTLGIGASLAAVALGASVIEKHVTLDRSSGGVDSSFSMEPLEFEALSRESQNVRLSLGQVKFGPSEGDSASLAFRRTLYVSRDVKAGEMVGPDNVKALRPGFGMAIANQDLLTGLVFAADSAKGTPVSMDLFKN